MDLREELFQPRPVRIYRDDWNGLYLYLRAAAPHQDPVPQSVTGNFNLGERKTIKNIRIGGSIRSSPLIIDASSGIAILTYCGLVENPNHPVPS